MILNGLYITPHDSLSQGYIPKYPQVKRHAYSKERVISLRIVLKLTMIDGTRYQSAPVPHYLDLRELIRFANYCFEKCKKVTRYASEVELLATMMYREKGESNHRRYLLITDMSLLPDGNIIIIDESDRFQAT